MLKRAIFTIDAKLHPSIETFHQRVERRGERAQVLRDRSSLRESCPWHSSETKSSSSSRRVAKERGRKHHGIRALIYRPVLFPRLVVFRWEKKKERKNILVAEKIDVPRWEVIALLLLKIIEMCPWFSFFKFPKTFFRLSLRLKLLSIFRSKSKYTKDSAPRISKIFKINILARKRIKQSLPSNFHGKNPLSFSSIVESSNIASNVCFQKKKNRNQGMVNMCGPGSFTVSSKLIRQRGNDTEAATRGWNTLRGMESLDALIHHLLSIVLFLFRPLVFEGNLSLVVPWCRNRNTKDIFLPRKNGWLSLRWRCFSLFLF